MKQWDFKVKLEISTVKTGLRTLRNKSGRAEWQRRPREYRGRRGKAKRFGKSREAHKLYCLNSQNS